MKKHFKLACYRCEFGFSLNVASLRREIFDPIVCPFCGEPTLQIIDSAIVREGGSNVPGKNRK